jgi:hypothetical protein
MQDINAVRAFALVLPMVVACGGGDNVGVDAATLDGATLDADAETGTDAAGGARFRWTIERTGVPVAPHRARQNSETTRPMGARRLALV